MSKSSGLGDNLYVGGYNLSGDTGSLSSIHGGPSALMVTGIDKSAIERIGGTRDGGIDWSSWFNPSASQAHPVLSVLPTTDVHLMYCRGTALGSPAACMVSKQINYDPKRGKDGSLSFDLKAVSAANGLEWGTLATAGLITTTTTTPEAGIDFAASTSFGLQAYLQVTAFTGTSVTFTLQHSNDDAATDPYSSVTGGAFAATSAANTTQRIETTRALTIKRWIRIAHPGTFTSVTFAIVIMKNETQVLF